MGELGVFFFRSFCLYGIKEKCADWYAILSILAVGKDKLKAHDATKSLEKNKETVSL